MLFTKARQLVLPQQHNTMSLVNVQMCEVTSAGLCCHPRGPACRRRRRSPLLQSPPPLTHLLICSPSVSPSPSPVSVYCSPSILSPPLSSPDGSCITGMAAESKQLCFFLFLLFFFYLHRSFSASLPGLILVSSHCEVLNASYHMAAGSGLRCRGAFIGASERSCNNSCRGLVEFVVMLMLARADPSRSPAYPNPPTSPNPLNSFCLLFYTKPQIGSGVFTGRGQSQTTK